MSILSAYNVSKSYGAEEIFAGISVQIPNGAKIALVGPNGAGKTTLLHLLIGLDLPSTGEVQHKRGLTMGFLPQRPLLAGERTLWEEMLTAFTALQDQQAKLTELEYKLADSIYTDQHEQLLVRYGALQESFEDGGGYTYEYEIKRVLQGLGFQESDFTRPLTQLSGGQVTRALLARLLLEKPDLLVLDEPTNHLDIQAVEWLEGYLRNWPNSVLLVSHDRYFMDRVVHTIWELDFGQLVLYRGNYSQYIHQREAHYEGLMKEYAAQQEFIEKEQDYIRRHIAGQNTRQAKGKLRRLERLMKGTDRLGRPVENPWLIQRPRRRPKLHLQLDATQAGRTGKEVLKTKSLRIGYPQNPLFTVPDILLMRGEVAAIIGPNGAGKSTFLKTILGQLPPILGEYIWGSNVKIGYFAQSHEALNENNTVLEELLTVKNIPISKARDYLGGFLFSGDDVYQPVNTLSGGERGRLALAKLALGGANVLLLDEPTNHLDIPAQEILQNVLADYEGTILLVSHDRYLVDALATQIWNATSEAMTVFAGSYQQYLEYREAKAASIIDSNARHEVDPGNGKSVQATERRSGLSPYALRKRLEALEAVIHQLEAVP
jgi:ATP-binding cassette subfamily F protein 3